MKTRLVFLETKHVSESTDRQIWSSNYVLIICFVQRFPNTFRPPSHQMQCHHKRTEIFSHSSLHFKIPLFILFLPSFPLPTSPFFFLPSFYYFSPLLFSTPFLLILTFTSNSFSFLSHFCHFASSYFVLFIFLFSFYFIPSCSISKFPFALVFLLRLLLIFFCPYSFSSSSFFFPFLLFLFLHFSFFISWPAPLCF
jgi:hypothetical protein